MKKVLVAVLVLAVIGVGTAIYMWNKPHEKVEDKKGIVVAAEVLVNDFSENEQEANSRYLDKAIEVTGVVSETETNQDGGVMIILDTGDPFAAVQCTMREKTVSVSNGQPVTVKGFCSGFGITGVSLTDCILK